MPSPARRWRLGGLAAGLAWRRPGVGGTKQSARTGGPGGEGWGGQGGGGGGGGGAGGWGGGERGAGWGGGGKGDHGSCTQDHEVYLVAPLRTIQSSRFCLQNHVPFYQAPNKPFWLHWLGQESTTGRLDCTSKYRLQCRLRCIVQTGFRKQNELYIFARMWNIWIIIQTNAWHCRLLFKPWFVYVPVNICIRKSGFAT